MKFTVALDANVVLDGLLQRTTMAENCLDILALAEDGEISANISSGNLLNVMYFLKKAGKAQTEIIATIQQLLGYIKITSATANNFIQSLSAGFTDLEDAVQYFTALDIKGIDYFITSNTKDFKKASAALPVVTPKALMQMWNEHSSKK